MTQTVFTFEEFVQYGLKHAKSESIRNGMPWHFNIFGYTVTHENDECYLILGLNGTLDKQFCKGERVTFEPDRIYIDMAPPKAEETRERNRMHALAPEVGDYWHEMFSPVCLVVEVTDTSVRVLHDRIVDKKGDWEWDTNKTRTYTRTDFVRWLQYASLPHLTWASVVPNWKPAKEYIDKVFENERSQDSSHG